jgi:hypothetical protein
MRRPSLESLTRAEQLLKRSCDSRVMAARGEILSEVGRRRLWCLRVPRAVELEHSWAHAKVRIDVVEASGERRPHVLRSLRITRDEADLNIVAEERGSSLDRRQSRFLVSFENPRAASRRPWNSRWRRSIPPATRSPASTI